MEQLNESVYFIESAIVVYDRDPANTDGVQHPEYPNERTGRIVAIFPYDSEEGKAVAEVRARGFVAR